VVVVVLEVVVVLWLAVATVVVPLDVAAALVDPLDVAVAVVATLAGCGLPPHPTSRRLVAIAASDGRSLIAPSIDRPPPPSCTP
jgi:hypothetical protein